MKVANREFLNAIFGMHLALDRDPRLHAWVCEHRGDEAGVKANWTGTAWDGTDVPGTANAYFSIALLQSRAAPGSSVATVARRKGNFGLLPCVMLDDVGTKADSELPVEPSWLIETSPGNHQAGFIFSDPIENVHDADAFLKALTWRAV